MWTERLRPDTLIEDDSADPGALGAQARSAGTQHGSTVGMAIVRSGIDSSDEFPSPWTDWGVQITPRAYQWLIPRAIPRSSSPLRRLAVPGVGSAPGSAAGRLWVSDAEGLRAFEP